MRRPAFQCHLIVSNVQQARRRASATRRRNASETRNGRADASPAWGELQDGRIYGRELNFKESDLFIAGKTLMWILTWFSVYATCSRGRERLEWIQVGPWVWAVSAFFFTSNYLIYFVWQDLLDNDHMLPHRMKTIYLILYGCLLRSLLIFWLSYQDHAVSALSFLCRSFDLFLNLVHNRYVLRCSWPEVPNGWTWLWGPARDGSISRRLDGQWHGNVFYP